MRTRHVELCEYIECYLRGLSTQQALDTLFRYYGRRNLLTEDFYEDLIKLGKIERVNK